MSAPSPPRNVADYLPTMAAERPEAPAMYIPKKRRRGGRREYDVVTYRTLDSRSERIAAGLLASGLPSGARVALMVKPGEDFFALMFGLFKASLVPVLVDPGLGVKNVSACLAKARPEAFIAIPAAQLARMVLGWGRATLTRTITVGPRPLWRGERLADVEAQGSAALRAGATLPGVDPDDDAAILFTSGSTGPPKGVVYRHRHFTAQVEALREMFDIRPGEVNLPTFPPFALFDPALGVTSVIPFMDPTRPAKVDPREILEPVERFGVTMMFGSPALLNTVGRWADARGERMPSVRRVIAAGAPLPAPTIERWQRILSDDARVYPPYGATECLPVACVPSDEIVGETWAETERGAGVCVGRPVDSIRVEIIAITDESIPRWSDVDMLPDGEIGEMVVQGPMVTESYFDDTHHTELAKIPGEDGRVWHRMGDLGWRDEQGRLWFCGRKAHRVVLPDCTLFTVPIEKVFDTHPKVFRSALVGARLGGEVVPVLCVELEAGQWVARSVLADELREIGRAHPDAHRIAHVLTHESFPVDIRHNAKIGRERLARWAEEKLA